MGTFEFFKESFDLPDSVSAVEPICIPSAMIYRMQLATLINFSQNLSWDLDNPLEEFLLQLPLLNWFRFEVTGAKLSTVKKLLW